jgi:hypothetical protein
MGDFKLPEINPVLVDRRPEMFDRLGSQINQAMQQVAAVPAGLDKARVIFQAQEAQYNRQQRVNNFLAETDRNSVPTKDEVQALLGGDDLPPAVEQMYQTAGDKGVEMFRILPHLAPLVAEKATAEAQAGVEGEGWKQKFRQAADTDNQQLLAHVREKSTGMERMAMALQGEAYYEDARNRGDIAGMKTYAALNPDPKTRAARLAGLSHDVAVVEARGMLNPQGTPEERLLKLDAAKKAIENDEIIRPADLPEGVPTPKRGAALTAPEKATFQHSIDQQATMIRKEIYQAILAPAESHAKMVMNLPPQQAREYLTKNPILIDPRLTFEDAKRIDEWQQAVQAGKDILPNEVLYARLRASGDAMLKGLDDRQVDMLRFSFPPARHKEIIDLWSRLKEGKDSDSILTPRVTGMIKDTVEKYVTTHKDDPLRFNLNADDLAAAVISEFRRSPTKDYFVTQALVSKAAMELITRGDAKTFGDTGYKDSDVGADAAAHRVLQGSVPGQPRPVRADEKQALIKAAYKADVPIKAAWGTWAKEQDITKADIVEIYAEATRRRGYWEDQIRREAAKDGKAPVKDITESMIYDSVVSSRFANVQSREQHPATRDALQVARDRKVLADEAAKVQAVKDEELRAARAKEKRDLFLQGGAR